jgi:hypothetical protein
MPHESHVKPADWLRYFRRRDLIRAVSVTYTNCTTSLIQGISAERNLVGDVMPHNGCQRKT